MGAACGKPADAPLVVITKGVEFNVAAREWRCKWSDNSCLKALQELAVSYKDQLTSLPGFLKCYRVVCGSCKDFKIITVVNFTELQQWEGQKFAPEEEFLKKMGEIAGVTTVETQTYTFMPVGVDEAENSEAQVAGDFGDSGVTFNTVAKEWRCKWSDDDDKQSLQDLQGILAANLDAIKAVPGVVDVRRIVCGACKDFKIVVAIKVSSMDAWKGLEAPWAPEKAVMDAMTAVKGVTNVEEQLYSLMALF